MEILDFVDYKAVASIWGAGLSTILAIIKISENRFKIDVAYLFRGGNRPDEVLITNLYRKGIIITNYKVIISRNRWSDGKPLDVGLSDDLLNISIKPNEACKLVFQENNKISDYQLPKSMKFYIELTIAGKGKIIKRLNK